MRFSAVLLFLLTLFAPTMYGSMVDIRYSGDATGSLGGTLFTNVPFYVDFLGDTAAATEPYGAGGGTSLQGISASFGVGQTIGLFTNPTSWFAGGGSGDVIFHAGVGYTDSPGIGTLGFGDFSLPSTRTPVVPTAGFRVRNPERDEL
jgi:hypothetical protein